MDTDEQKLQSLEDDYHRQLGVNRSRRDRVEMDNSLCLQIEASLIELTHENSSTKRSLDSREAQIIERRASLEKKIEEITVTLLQAEDMLRVQRERQDSLSDGIELGWRTVEDELKSMDACHAYEVSRLKKSQRDLEERESLIREKTRFVSEREQELHSQERRLQARERLIGEIGKTSLERRIAELQEREALLHNEDAL
jgi:CRISPR/Cas system endoribonuclease Cas6 (RAMP superfamily)